MYSLCCANKISWFFQENFISLKLIFHIGNTELYKVLGELKNVVNLAKKFKTYAKTHCFYSRERKNI